RAHLALEARVARLGAVARVAVTAVGVGVARRRDAPAVEADLAAGAARRAVRHVRARLAGEGIEVAGLVSVARLGVRAVGVAGAARRDARAVEADEVDAAAHPIGL